jgi:pyroglutamyl-peptidase
MGRRERPRRRDHGAQRRIDSMSTDVFRTKVLLTGFRPFPTQPINATELLVPELARLGRLAFPDVRFAHDILPTEWRSAPWHLEALLETETPDISLHFGIASRARGFEIETRAQNRRAGGHDATGRNPESIEIWPGGPSRLPVSLPSSEIVRRLRRAQIPAHVSRDAGSYVCNAVLFHALTVRAHAPSRIGFIHIPSDLGLPGRRQTMLHRTCPLTWATAVRGGLEIIAACLGRNAFSNSARAQLPRCNIKSRVP